MFKRDDDDYDPMIQITDASTKFRTFTLNSYGDTYKQAILQASDKNGCYVTIKISN